MRDVKFIGPASDPEEISKTNVVVCMRKEDMGDTPRKPGTLEARCNDCDEPIIYAPSSPKVTRICFHCLPARMEAGSA